MSIKNDWRLQGQEKYLKGNTLYFKKYTIQRENWDHDHCEFCSKKFSVFKDSGDLTEGYTTKDKYRWICKVCFKDFKDLFQWKLEEEKW
ncbi:MAG: hypothetical protein GY729_12720 [Desulfobacteraceae bacterium]|nr:hypothetical protein [Desulfobacteraceae bacterium]